jgi:esterase FrsA
MGRSAGTWPDPVIFKKIILPWEARHLNVKTGTP